MFCSLNLDEKVEEKRNVILRFDVYYAVVKRSSPDHRSRLLRRTRIGSPPETKNCRKTQNVKKSENFSENILTRTEKGRIISFCRLMKTVRVCRVD